MVRGAHAGGGSGASARALTRGGHRYREDGNAFFFQVVPTDDPEHMHWQALVGPLAIGKWRDLRQQARESDVMIAVGSTKQGQTGYYVAQDMSLVYAFISTDGHWRCTLIK